MAPRDEERQMATETTSLLRPSLADNTVHGTNTAPEDEDERTIIAEQVSVTKLAVILSTAWFGIFLGAADSTIIATLTGPISSEFDSLSLLSWLATAYLISTAACQPILGRLTDIFGRGPGLVFSNLVFAAGNLLCALASSQWAMIAGRVIAGIGGGGLMSIPTYLNSDLVPLRKRGLVGGIATVWFGCGGMLGSVMGGFLHDHTQMGWRMAFFVQVPPSLASALMVHCVVKVPPKQSQKSYISRIDFLGGLLVSSFMVLFVLGLNSGGNLVPWTHPLPPTMLTMSAVVFAVLLWWESKARMPIIPVKLLRDPTVLASCLSSLFASMVALTGIFYIPLYLEVLGNSATDAGMTILPSALGTTVGALGSGYVIQRTGNYVRIVLFHAVCLVAGVGMFTFLDKNTSTWFTGVAYLIVGAGYMAVFSIGQLASIAAVDHSHQAVVTSSTFLARSIGGTAGIAIASAIYQGILSSRLWEHFGDRSGGPDLIRRVLDDLSELRGFPEDWYEEMLSCFMEAFHGVWLVMLAWAGLSLISLVSMKQHKLHSNLERR